MSSSSFTSPTQRTPHSSNDKEKSSDNSAFECNICLETASEPVITQCGHLFCWPCIHQWLSQPNKETLCCPVCKAGVTVENLIPLYGRGDTSKNDPRKKTDAPRPSAHRPDPVRNPNHAHAQPNVNFGFFPGGPFAQAQFGNFSFSAGFGFFPSLFGLQFHTFGNDANANTAHMTPEQIQQARLSRFLLILGSFVILCLLLF
eukprot:GILI01009942.1.p1 GENE.GILI01009942.1~~GILI01009942.1.p1  ORF type:complete len:202 (+),score=26.12 GILI01009942.1:129-734(+)